MPKELKKADKLYLNFTIDGKEYKVPLARSLKIKDVRKMGSILKLEDHFEQLDLMAEFFANYIGADVVDELVSEELVELVDLWKKANDEIGEADLGES